MSVRTGSPGDDAARRGDGPASGSPGAPALFLDVRRTLPAFTLDAHISLCDEVLVLFGPSGAGKTTLLSMVAGLVRPDAGEIRIDDNVVFARDAGGKHRDVPARQRGVGYVMQSYALFPHMTALENVAFPLGRRGGSRRAHELLDLLGMSDHAHKLPRQLSGGQQQRVAVARALAAERRVLLLDEPFAALDGIIRDRLQADLRRIRAELGVTALLVTHRLEDAFAVGDRMAVMDGGRVLQAGPVRDVFERPVSVQVASVLGIRNVFEADVVSADDVAIRLDWDGLALDLPPERERRATLQAGARVAAFIQPEDVKFVYPGRPLNESIAGNVLPARVVASRESAGARLVWVQLSNGRELEVRFPRLSYAQLDLEPGATVSIAMRRDGITLLGRT